MDLPPHDYLKKRRTAAGLSLEDLALRTESTPAISCRSRAEWLGQVEEGLQPIGLDLLVGLGRAGVRFDLDVLLTLADRHYGGSTVPAPAICRECGCSDRDACPDILGGCAWANEAHDLCTTCVSKATVAPLIDLHGPVTALGAAS